MSAARKIDFRTRQLAAIHVAKAKLKLDDATYRALLARVTGKNSASELDAHQRSEVLRELARLQGVGASAQHLGLPGAPKQVRDELKAMVGKIEAILTETGRSWNYAHGIAKRMFGRARVEWLHADELHKLVAALMIDQKRRARRQP